MNFVKEKWPWGIGVLLVLAVAWWQFGPRQYELVYKGHKFEYLEPISSSTNRSAKLRIWVGYEGRRPRWWGQKVVSQVDGAHEWSFSNGVNVQGGGGSPATAEYAPEKDCYQYDLYKGLTAYRIENGEMVAVAGGLATNCQLSISFQDPPGSFPKQISMNLPLEEGREVFK